MYPRVPHRNPLVTTVPGCAIWERVQGLSNNEGEYMLVEEILEGSSDEEHEEYMPHKPLPLPRPYTQHEEYLQMLQYHRTIGSAPLEIMDAICQHYQKWEGMSQDDSEVVGSSADDSEWLRDFIIV